MLLTKNLIVIAFDNFVSSSFNYKIDCSNNYLCDVSYFDYKESYQQFSNWNLTNQLPSLYLDQDILTLIYQSQKNYEILYYDLNDNGNENVIGNVLKSVIAYLQSETINQSNIVQSFVYNYNQQLHLLSSTKNNSKLQHFILKRSPQICIDKQSLTQKANFQLKNLNQEKIIELNLNIKMNEPETSHIKLWIILGIILIIVIVGISVTVYCQRKKRKSVRQDLLIKN
ncbi:unnamed protein product [Paramecium sonneborni]|uniref:Transmembrane protein n=1 Tax=Paramecium sonneborni TaxID=65129 RepID=A0A8S1QZC2_9CILI|nr:unnamed protein product [Paramecium sonneborni]